MPTLTLPQPLVTAATPVASPLASSVATAVAGVFRVASRLRGERAIHARGRTFTGRLTVTGGAGTGATLLDAPGAYDVLLRLSRSVGLPAPLPDVLGLALRTTDADGDHDLLLSTTGSGRLTRFLLAPRRSAAGSRYGSVLPARSPRGLVVLAAVPVEGAEEGGARFRLVAATPTGPEEPFGELLLHGPLDGPDADLSFDPVLDPLPGLAVPAALAAVRGPAYAAARRASGRER